MRTAALALLVSVLAVTHGAAQSTEFAPAIHAAAALRLAAAAPTVSLEPRAIDAIAAAASSGNRELGTTLMIVGGAAVLAGAILQGGGGAALIIGGLAAGGYGYYLYQKK